MVFDDALTTGPKNWQVIFKKLILHVTVLPVVLFGRSMFMSKLCAENKSVGAGAARDRGRGGGGGRESRSTADTTTSGVYEYTIKQQLVNVYVYYYYFN